MFVEELLRIIDISAKSLLFVFKSFVFSKLDRRAVGN